MSAFRYEQLDMNPPDSVSDEDLSAFYRSAKGYQPVEYDRLIDPSAIVLMIEEIRRHRKLAIRRIESMKDNEFVDDQGRHWKRAE